ncbi:MAG: hypothetical protein J7M14_06875 [Planctomycetes bacterium]|nr:hypothetical protein [Planctomycetota bacterium]
MKQFVLTSSMGKRIIGRSVAARQDVQTAAKKGILAIIAGSTNAYVAEEVLATLGLAGKFSKDGFRRGTVVPPGFDASQLKGSLKGDVILIDGELQEGKQIFDVADDLDCGDVVVKGGNAVNLSSAKAGVLIGDPKCGTAGAVIGRIVGRRAKLIVPIGLEKRVEAEIADLAAMLNEPGMQGAALLPLPGEVVTELDAILTLTGSADTLIARGGICGAEGSVRLDIAGSEEQIAAAEALIQDVSDEPPYGE